MKTNDLLKKESNEINRLLFHQDLRGLEHSVVVLQCKTPHGLDYIDERDNMHSAVVVSLYLGSFLLGPVNFSPAS
jgi:hypothetical protein